MFRGLFLQRSTHRTCNQLKFQLSSSVLSLELCLKSSGVRLHGERWRGNPLVALVPVMVELTGCLLIMHPPSEPANTCDELLTDPLAAKIGSWELGL